MSVSYTHLDVYKRQVYYNSMLNKLNRVQVPSIDYSNLETEPEETTEAVTETTAATEETTVATTEPHVASSADYINILLVGQASREGEAERFADTMIPVSYTHLGAAEAQREHRESGL